MIQPYLYLGDPLTDTVWYVEDGKVWATVCYSDLGCRTSFVGRTLPLDIPIATFDALIQCHTDDPAVIKELFTPADLAEIAVQQFDKGDMSPYYDWYPNLVPLVGWSDG